MEKNKAALLLLPNVLAECKYPEMFLPVSVNKAVESLDGLIAESEQGGRRFLSRFQTKKPPQNMPIALLNEHTPDDHLDFLLEPMTKGERWGLVSDCGLPCLADPGSHLVQRARQRGIPVQAFVGPSSLFLSLMLSGFSGQCFTFKGYLGKDPEKRKEELRALEKDAKKGETQIFIEAPYRNQHTLESAVETLSDNTLLCVAWELTTPDQGVLSQSIALWKKSPLPNIHKKNAVFLIASG